MHFKKFAKEVTGTSLTPQFTIIDIAMVEHSILALGPKKILKSETTSKKCGDTLNVKSSLATWNKVISLSIQKLTALEGTCDTLGLLVGSSVVENAQ